MGVLYHSAPRYVCSRISQRYYGCPSGLLAYYYRPGSIGHFPVVYLLGAGSDRYIGLGFSGGAAWTKGMDGDGDSYSRCVYG